MSKIINRIPTGVVGIAGEVINDALFGTKRQKLNNTRPGSGDGAVSFQNFVSDLRARGIAKNNRHLLEMPLPKAFKDAATFSNGREFSISLGFQALMGDYMLLAKSCESIQFPGHTIQTTETRFQNHMSKFPYLRNFNDVTLVFRCDSDFLEKKLFDLWSFLIIDPVDGSIRYKTEYQTDIKIFQFDEDNTMIYEIDLINAFPVVVGDLDSSYSGQADYHRLSVTFTFDKLYIREVSGPFYDSSALQAATGTRQLSIGERLTKEFFDVGKNLVIREVVRIQPVGSIPGIGSISEALGRFGL